MTQPSTGRTSTPPPWWQMGLRRAISRATSRSGASMMQNPAITSFVSRNGPSVMTSPRIDVAIVCGSRAKAAIMVPSRCGSSECWSCSVRATPPSSSSKSRTGAYSNIAYSAMVALLSDDSLPPYILTSNHFGKFNSAIPRESRNLRNCRPGRIGPGDDRRPARSVSPLYGTDMSGNCEYATDQRAHCRFVWRNESLEGRHSWNRRHDTHYVEDSAQGRRERLVKDDKATVPDIGDFFYSSPDL